MKLFSGLLAGVAADCSPFRVRAQSLGDLAKKEAGTPQGDAAGGQDLHQRRSEEAAAGARVDRRSRSEAGRAKDAAKTDAKDATPAEAAAKPGDAKADDQAGGTREGRRRTGAAAITAVREDIRRNEMFRDALQTRINALTADFTARDDPVSARADRRRSPEGARRAGPGQHRNREGDKQIADIEEEARRAGVPPGWLR